MDRPKPGHAVIINNVHSEIPGSQVDLGLLVECYKTVGFDVQVHKDCDTQVPFMVYLQVCPCNQCNMVINISLVVGAI